MEHVTITASNTELAYAAGLIDGEGCIRLGKLSNRNSVPEAMVGLQVNCANTDYAVLQWMKDTYGGEIYGKPRVLPHHKLCWYWTVVGKNGATFLSLILPYMKIKKEQAQVALMFAETLHRQWKQDSRGLPLTDEAKHLRCICAAYFKQVRNVGRRSDGQERRASVLALCA